jgi:hypothetical protein
MCGSEICFFQAFKPALGLKQQVCTGVLFRLHATDHLTASSFDIKAEWM